MTTAKDEDARRAPQPRQSVWLRQVPGQRRRTSAAGAGNLDRERIVTAAVQLLDSEGEAQFSMRRLAADLKVTPMSVYWYVNCKDDLLEFALDAVVGRIRLPGTSAGFDWQDDLLALAVAWRHTMIAHPWALGCYAKYVGIGPHSVRFSLRVQDILARSPIPEALRPTALSAVFRFMYGFTSLESLGTARGQAVGSGTDEPTAVRDFARGLTWLVTGMSTEMTIRP
ncbi:TetR family transcriptional regulator [Streptomyces sp. SID685]|uniref:TetR/AcrR family transcriptional regulator n=1 Tax=Streptomyces sp. SID685 TaxID=2690322 RepID=UPI00137016CE|nr:TetR/AcrR family transcriptional regulator [Streptomyces sp. SID685]MYR83673.1 TetR family transcriptional regulator [Streptomyces sp. SID685]